LDLLNRYGLKGVFFIEPLFAEVAGRDPLKSLIEEVQKKGHEVQAHIHPEWLAWMENPLIAGATPDLLKDYAENDQETLIRRAIDILVECGSENPSAFRAGDYAADLRTLRALARLGVKYDTSYNEVYLGGRCGMHTPAPIRQETVIEGVHEVPVSMFSDWPGHYRHAQLCACSFGEMRSALTNAHRLGWHSFVIVSHSFEMLRRRRKRPESPMPDWLVVRRFERLCRFLADHRDRFETVGFAKLDPPARSASAVPIPRSIIYDTLTRMGGQLLRRVGYLRG
jgi:peptidoglycan/xylan/chitin deacetylase (PgdA/CDA1 family)